MSKCKYCDKDSGECEYWIDSLDGQWYQEIQTYEWDTYSDDYIRMRNYSVRYCQYCGKELKDKQDENRLYQP